MRPQLKQGAQIKSSTKKV